MKLNPRDWFKRSDILQYMYAIREGDYKGCFFVCVSIDEDKYNFLSLPDREPVSVPKDDFSRGIKTKIVDLVEKIPYNVFTVCEAQYNSEIKRLNNSRLKQPAAPSSLDNRKRKNRSKS